jgi:butyrate kinase
MLNYSDLINTLGEISKSENVLNLYEEKFVGFCEKYLKQLQENLISNPEDPDLLEEQILNLLPLIKSLITLTKKQELNDLLGSLFSYLIKLERKIPYSQKIVKRLLGKRVLDNVIKDNPKVLVINPGSTSTKVALFEGISKTHESEVHLSPDALDGVEARGNSIIKWLEKINVKIDELTGIACRGGFIKPVPSGTYIISPQMVQDLENPRIKHASNLAILIGVKLSQMSSKKLFLTTSDPVVTDEMELVERMTGFSKIKKDGSGAHYLNHKAVIKVIASILKEESSDLDGISAHIGGGSSIALHRDGKVPALIDAFSGIPSANRSGTLDIPRLLHALKHDVITMKELEAITFSRGGLLSLANTNDFRALSNFVHQGASEDQKEKINLIFDFYGRKISSSIMKLNSDGKPVQFVAITGGLAHSEEIITRIKHNLNNKFPIFLLPGSIEHESLAAGLLRGMYKPDTLKSYVKERDELHSLRHAENNLMDTVIFERNLLYRKENAPILSLDELIDVSCIKVKEKYAPTIGIIGADNEEAILAAKRANEKGVYRIAKFQLLGDYGAINKIAYDYDLIIDNDNYIIDDHEDPIERGVQLLEENKVQILMKGSYKTEKILRGVFKYLKKSGKLKKGELISHSVVMDIPIRNKLLIISDAAVNTYPDKNKKIQIIENALKIAKSLNVKKPKVAIISAIESVNKNIESSVEADEIAKVFKDRKDCIVEGPLSFDVAMDADIANEKKYPGEIKGSADILIMPDIDAGNVLYKTLTTQSGAICAGVILCGNMPMILTSRGDSARSKLASISLSVKLFFELQKYSIEN